MDVLPTYWSPMMCTLNTDAHMTTSLCLQTAAPRKLSEHHNYLGCTIQASLINWYKNWRSSLRNIFRLCVLSHDIKSCTRGVLMSENSKKVIVIGDGCVGKTCLVSKISEGKFINNYHTTIGGNLGELGGRGYLRWFSLFFIVHSLSTCVKWLLRS